MSRQDLQLRMALNFYKIRSMNNVHSLTSKHASGTTLDANEVKVTRHRP